MSEKPVTDIRHEAPDISRLMAPGAEPRQGMQGFDPDYVDIVDYIVRCTHKIWEEGGLGLIYSHYQHNAVIHTTDGLTYGRDKVIADSLRTLAGFPDVRLYADDVIWSGDDQAGFHSSHRIVWVGTNTGHTIYGPPTGRRVVRQGIAHCFVKANRVVEEWICRDELAVIRQLGFDEHELARRLAAQEAALGLRNPRPVNQGEVARLAGQTTPAELPPPSGPGFQPEDFVRRSFHEIWNWRLLNRIPENFAPGYLCRTSTNRELYGLGDYKAYVLEFFSAFPDLALTVDHVAVLGDEQRGYRVATRWTMQGTHLGPSHLGPPTGKRILLLGITHQEIEGGRFVREWTAFDEFALLKQLYAPAE